MKKISLKIGAVLLISCGLLFSQLAMAQEDQSKSKSKADKTKVDDTKTKATKDEHDHSTGGAVVNGVSTSTKSAGKGVGKAGKSVGKAATKVTEPVH